MKITVEHAQFGLWLIKAEDGRDILAQLDLDFPGLAQNFGYVPCTQCGETDGTIDCAHRTVEEMIADAGEFLNEGMDLWIEDPGYFESD